MNAPTTLAAGAGEAGQPADPESLRNMAGLESFLTEKKYKAFGIDYLHLKLPNSGDLYLTHTKLDGKFTLRMSIGQTHTGAEHVARAWARIREEADVAKPNYCSLG